jgi:transcriptional regulator with XRE-family HTH domain
MQGVQLPMNSTPSSPPTEGVVERARAALASRNMTLFHVSRESRLRYPRDPAFHIPHNLYYDLRTEGFSPKIQQVIALSAISKYRLTDWLAVFGFRLDEIPRLQATLPAERTTLIDSTVYDIGAWVEWFRENQALSPSSPIAPLGQLLVPGAFRRANSLLLERPSAFLYAKIGWQDAFAFPELLPGSVVRADTRIPKKLDRPGVPRRLFLIERGEGLACCRVHIARENHVTLRSPELPYAQVELQVPREARILGALDLEMRPLTKTPMPEVPVDLATFSQPEPLRVTSGELDFPRCIAAARARAGLSLREASAKSRRVAEALGDRRYFCARGTLSDYEARATPPRHIQKIMALCILYGLSFWEILTALGFEADDGGREAIPDSLLGRNQPRRSVLADSAEPAMTQEGFLSGLVAKYEEIPLFLRGSLASIAGLTDVSLRDVFWVGGPRASLHPYLRDSVFVFLNRRNKTPALARSRPSWAQPLYLLMKRDGSYLCAGCSMDGDVLLVHPFADGFDRPLRFRNAMDAQVVGRLVAIVRKLP